MSEQNEKTFNVFVDEEGILRLVFLTVADSREEKVAQAQGVAEAVQEILEVNPGKKYDVLVDFMPLGSFQPFYPAKARSIGALLMSNKQLDRWAIVSMTKMMQVTTNFVAVIAGKKDFKWFSDKKEAVLWLKENN